MAALLQAPVTKQTRDHEAAGSRQTREIAVAAGAVRGRLGRRGPLAPGIVAVPLSVPFLIGSAILAMRIRDRAALDRI
jgi:hypothetical protein